LTKTGCHCRILLRGIRNTKTFVKDIVNGVASSIEEKQPNPDSNAGGVRVAIIYFSDVATLHLSFTSVIFIISVI
jgi:hypothetical protein